MYYDAGNEAATQARISNNKRVDEFRASQGLPPFYAADGITLASQAGGGNGNFSNFVNSMSGGGGNPGMNVSTTTSAPANNPFAGQVTSYQKRLSDLLDNPNSIKASAAYKFRVGQGLDVLNRQLGVKGLLNSGNRFLETEKYGQDMASQEYDQQFKRLSDTYGANVTGFGNSQSADNQATSIANNNRLGWAKIWNDQNPPTQFRTQSSSNISPAFYGV